MRVKDSSLCACHLVRARMINKHNALNPDVEKERNGRGRKNSCCAIFEFCKEDQSDYGYAKPATSLQFQMLPI